MQKKILILIPAYNSDDKIGYVLNDFLKFKHDILVVNDGSLDNTVQEIKKFPKVHLIENEINSGKGVALEKGFNYAIDNNYNAVVTIDADYQHLPEDFPKFIDSYNKANNENILILGDRHNEFHKMPKSNKLGNVLSSKWLSFTTRQKIYDSQCGYRLYTTELLKKVKIKAKRFGYETEFIIKSARKKAKFINVPVKAVYPEELETHKSHYRSFIDTIRIIGVLARCLLRL